MRQNRLQSTRAIVLKRRNYGEADRILTLFTQYTGKVQAIAKGIRRVPSRRSGHLEVFSHAKIGLYQGKTFDIVTEAQRLQPLISRTDDVVRVSYAYYICELVDKLTVEGQEQEDVYELLMQTLTDIDKTDSIKAWGACIHASAMQLLWMTGYLPKQHAIDEVALEKYIEQIIERRLATPRILTKLVGEA